MREVKFRAWHKKDKLMGEVICLPIGNHSGEDVQVYLGDYIERPYLTDGLEDFEVMQYTGIKDKHGIEIYEGDIVIAGCAKQVVNLEIYTSIQRDHGDCGFTKGLKIASGYGMGEDIEVIGNIHQNPELIKAP